MLKDEEAHTKILFLFEKYLEGQCSEDEALEIVDFLDNPANHVLRQAAESHWNRLDATIRKDSVPGDIEFLTGQILDRLHHRIRLNDEINSKKRLINKHFISLFTKAAAVLILPLLIYSIFLTSRITKTLKEANQVVWQTIKTPAGMQTDFLLPDGSHVWLNSGSVFRYPARFASGKRQVELKGEAFFDIVKDTLNPFLVKAGKMNIEVKGTRFNVVNYPDETPTELVLQSGSIRLFAGNYEENKTITHIKPGERAVLDSIKNKLTVSNVNVDKYTAWKDGVLIFRDDQMDEVVRKLNRWFNVEIILSSPELKEYVYTATYRDETLAEILELLRISAPVRYNSTDRVRLDDNSYSKRKIVITKIQK